MFKYDVVVVGTGRVGLPLALSLAEGGLKVAGLDINAELREKVKKKQMPFSEPGYDKLIKEADFFITGDENIISKGENIIITVGTPLITHMEADFSHIQKVSDSLIKHARKGQLLVLRSTIAPGTTKFVREKIELETDFKIGKDLFLAFCPERIVEGKAYEELQTLPQIIGAEDKESAKRAEKLFKHIAKEIIHTDYVSAELVKIFNNTSRYVYFALSNKLALMADLFDKDIYELLETANHNYPRPIVAQPGLTAGTCLRKDFAMLNENIPYADMFLTAWKINEYIPKFLVSLITKKGKIHGKTVGVLGYTFKKDSDDTRDSLVPKLIRYIERETPKELLVHEPHLGKMLDGKYPNKPLKEVLEKADIIFIAMNHTAFQEGIRDIIKNSRKGTLFTDIWNLTKKNKILYSKEEMLELL